MYRRSGRGRVLLLVFLVLCVVIITLDYRSGDTGPLERAKDISTAIVSPIQRGLTVVFRPVGDFFSSIGDLSHLRSENARLEGDLAEAESKLDEADAILSENEELKAQLELEKSWPTMDQVHASVIATIPNNYRWAVRIDKGANDGIEPDMAVIAPDGLVGKIIRTSDSSSIVLLLIDPNAAAHARVKERGYVGVIRGNGADEPLSMDEISTDARVNVGDEIVTSGYDLGIFPASIPIGHVVSASGAGAEYQQDIEVEPWVDFSSLDFVDVLLESGPRLDSGKDEPSDKATPAPKGSDR
ncbi:MAG TPA: rod shape-determining protein MreC [Actinomycetota bacterium]|nr:rod shape-determining protein MreC [Actinomycetota bacterium]